MDTLPLVLPAVANPLVPAQHQHCLPFPWRGPHPFVPRCGALKRVPVPGRRIAPIPSFMVEPVPESASLGSPASFRQLLRPAKGQVRWRAEPDGATDEDLGLVEPDYFRALVEDYVTGLAMHIEQQQTAALQAIVDGEAPAHTGYPLLPMEADITQTPRRPTPDRCTAVSVPPQRREPQSGVLPRRRTVARWAPPQWADAHLVDVRHAEVDAVEAAAAEIAKQQELETPQPQRTQQRPNSADRSAEPQWCSALSPRNSRAPQRNLAPVGVGVAVRVGRGLGAGVSGRRLRPGPPKRRKRLLPTLERDESGFIGSDAAPPLPAAEPRDEAPAAEPSAGEQPAADQPGGSDPPTTARVSLASLAAGSLAAGS